VVEGRPEEAGRSLRMEREKLHKLANHRQCFQPIPLLIENRAGTTGVGCWRISS
jgi:hypothetical protein